MYLLFVVLHPLVCRVSSWICLMVLSFDCGFVTGDLSCVGVARSRAGAGFWRGFLPRAPRVSDPPEPEPAPGVMLVSEERRKEHSPGPDWKQQGHSREWGRGLGHSQIQETKGFESVVYPFELKLTKLWLFCLLSPPCLYTCPRARVFTRSLDTCRLCTVWGAGWG